MKRTKQEILIAPDSVHYKESAKHQLHPTLTTMVSQACSQYPDVWRKNAGTEVQIAQGFLQKCWFMYLPMTAMAAHSWVAFGLIFRTLQFEDEVLVSTLDF